MSLARRTPRQPGGWKLDPSEARPRAELCQHLPLTATSELWRERVDGAWRPLPPPRSVPLGLRSHPLACCSAPSHSTSHRKPPLRSSGVRSVADSGSTTKGIVFARTEYIPQLSADGGWGFEVIAAPKNACLQSMGEPHLCSVVADYVLQLPERGNVGEKKCSDDCLKLL